MPAGYEVVTTYNQQGFPVAVTQAIGAASAPKHYNEQGFLITSAAATALDTRSTQAPAVAEKDVVSSDIIANADSSTSSSSGSAKTTSAPPTGAATRLDGYRIMGAVLILCGVMIVTDPLFC